tara:strand:+ start:86 stop:706 length:621 start_codon:yes stop_codon:yes gene_type:complete
MKKLGKKRPLVIGVTGGIGSGKSTVCKIFGSLYGIPEIDTDKLARQAVKKNSQGLLKVVDIFGKEVINTEGELDRKAVRKIIFSDAQKKIAIEKIIHPIVQKLAKESIRNINSQYCLLAIPLINPRKINPLIDRILTIDCEESTQIVRVMKRDNAKKSDVIKIIEAQLPRAKRNLLADDIITNENNASETELQVRRLHKLYKNLTE